MKIFIGDISFPTKDAGENYTRNIINTLGCCIITKTHEHFSFFVDLVNNHTYANIKIGCGIKKFRISKNKGNYWHIDIIRIDNSSEDFSWKTCSRGVKTEKQKKMDQDKKPKLNLILAMRQYINNDINEFKEIEKVNNKWICMICYKISKNVHVDHTPPFEKISKEFLELNNVHPLIFIDTGKKEKFNKHDVSYDIKFRDCDFMFAEKWLVYHYEKATLQMLCKECNQLKSNN